MNEPPRRTQRRTHLDASVVPVERAYLARAAVLEDQATQLAAAADDDALPKLAEFKVMLAAEHRALAEELHYW